jgi:hypothetical protein
MKDDAWLMDIKTFLKANIAKLSNTWAPLSFWITLEKCAYQTRTLQKNNSVTRLARNNLKIKQAVSDLNCTQHGINYQG